MSSCLRLPTVVAILAFAFAPLALADGAAVRQVRSFEIERSDTRVGLAKVILDVEGLSISRDRVEGTYAIRIPLAPMMNDYGRISLKLNEPMEQVIALGRVLRGSGLSVEDGRVHGIECAFRPDGTVKITVTTPDRVLAFNSRVHVRS